jgi:hypothetical protein
MPNRGCPLARCSNEFVQLLALSEYCINPIRIFGRDTALMHFQRLQLAYIQYLLSWDLLKHGNQLIFRHLA